MGEFLKTALRVFFIHSSKVRPLYSGFPSPKTKLRHLSLSLVSSSVSPYFTLYIVFKTKYVFFSRTVQWKYFTMQHNISVGRHSNKES
jgi:hypothetical protein